MPAKSQTVRLSKAAKEFNVGIATIVEFLASSGHDIDTNPNTKIDGAAYEILKNEFQDSKTLKEKSKLAGVSSGKRETVSLDRNEPQVEKPAKEEPEEIFIKNVQGTQDDDDIIRPSVTRGPGISVVGKIDLDKKKNALAEEKKKEEEAKAKEQEETKAKEEASKKEASKKEAEAKEAKSKEEAEKAKSEVAKAEEKDDKAKEEKEIEAKPKDEKAKDEPKEAPAKEKEEAKPVDDNTIRTNVGRLAGPTVVGKIDLPERPKKKKKPVMSTDPGTETQQSRRKRKRIAPKVDPKRTGAAPPDRTQGGGPRKPAAPQKGRKPVKGGGPRQEVSKEDIDRELRETLAKLSGGSKSRGVKNRRLKRDEHRTRAEERALQQQEESKTLRLTEFVTVSDLASLMDVSIPEIISACMSLGIMASINQRLDGETLTIVAEEFGYEVEFTSAEGQEAIAVEEDKPEDLQDRAPIVTVMGHVDHGKTSLLDYIRKENVIGGEAGGITQHIGAYSVELENGKRITFLDTPGHEAFTAMRARGAQVTDLAIIVVAADDDVMPQTKEAINHAQAAGIPMIFAINKIDKEGAKPERIKEQLAQMNILVEDWGGKFQSQEISAKKGLNIEELLEKVLLEAEVLELKANPDKNAIGTVIESTLDKGRGYVTTIIVEGGTLNVGDIVLAGHYTGRVKAMYNERGVAVKSAGPSIPVSMLGLNGAPSAGDRFNVLKDEREARGIATRREQLQREQGVRTQKHITLDEIGRRIAIGDFKELNIILKGDVDGSVEALADSLQKLSTEKIAVNVIHKAVGQITESDVLLATASDAIIVGFQVRPSGGARRLAEKEEIQIKIYSIIYAAIEDVKDAMEGMLSAKIEEKIMGNAEIRETFKISKVGTIAGCIVTDGKITRNAKIRVIRDGIVAYTGELGTLKRFKDDVKEVTKGYECGLNVEKFNDIKVGDIIEAFEEIEVKQTLAD
ncbi:translation initiation factor IF-2 [Cryomorpha ignava]|uniref:Translation initiation factor IF-2 n=1 Tax=Cryomorpha ignava TaxID=101383 RepID=A0A7K3WJS6_9FLAO|nr:translation initiation factor IF-2 [Cryomorpha ignava]NEN21903.1 translation initiation factor IF-2 [Cryomorpha ignava]